MVAYGEHVDAFKVCCSSTFKYRNNANDLAVQNDVERQAGRLEALV